jgi:putative DNA primase/helicase
MIAMKEIYTLMGKHIRVRLRQIANGLDRMIGMPLPAAVEFSFENIPEDLRTRPIWMPFRFALNRSWVPGDPHPWLKLPVNPHIGTAGSVTDPDCWGSFEQARGYYAAHALDENPRTVAHGIGFVVCRPYVALDLDHHVVGGVIDDLALNILNRMNTRCELSISGTGLHLVCRSSFHPDRCKYSDGVEIYWRNRYLTVTGVVLPEHAEINDRDS